MSIENITVRNIIDFFAICIIVFQFFKWIISFGNPFVELKKRVQTLESYMGKDKDHFDSIDAAIRKMDDGITVLGKAINEMLRHEITGNDIQALKEQQKEVNNYFYGDKK